MTPRLLALACALAAAAAHADWYHFVVKVACGGQELRIVDRSGWNEEGAARAREPGAIGVDRLSTWKSTADGLRVPDQPRPRSIECRIPAGRYRVTLTNAGGGYSAPFPVVNVEEVSDPKRPVSLLRDLELRDSARYKRFEIVFSSAHPRGRTIAEEQPPL